MSRLGFQLVYVSASVLVFALASGSAWRLVFALVFPLECELEFE